MPTTQINAYHLLSPDEVLNAVEQTGLVCDGTLLALNSYENRVYRVGIEQSDTAIFDSEEDRLASSIIVKFYRPERWSDEAILEEHQFTQQLAELEIPVVAPLSIRQQTLHKTPDYRFALFANRGGRAPDLEDYDLLEQLGRFMGRIHQVGKAHAFEHRPQLTIDTFGIQSREFILQNDFLPMDLRPAYESLTTQLLSEVEMCYQRAGDVKLIRTHGDCHPSNILVTEGQDNRPHFHIVDFDDARLAPAIQDLWMFISGDRPDMTVSLDALLTGYTEFCQFDARELHLVEALRTLRLMHYYAWLAKRWGDPAFKIAFPWFNTQQCWEQHILSLREQAALLHEQPLAWMG